MIAQGKALYWGTSEWSAGDIPRRGLRDRDKHHLHKPLMEQPQYHLFHRKRVEKQYLRLYEDIGLGLTTWSPLASGLLTGKYARGARRQPRCAARHGVHRRKPHRPGEDAAVAQLEDVAADLGCSVAQLAIAWAAKNPRVSTVITGASKVSQLQSNLAAAEVIPKLTPEVMQRIDVITLPHST